MDAMLEKVGIQVFVEPIVKEDGRRAPMDFVGKGNLDARLELDLGERAKKEIMGGREGGGNG